MKTTGNPQGREATAGRIKPVLLSGLAAAATSAVLLGVCSVLMATGVIPEKFGDGCVPLSAFISGWLWARLTGRRCGGEPLTAAAVGAAQAAVLWVTGLLLYRSADVRWVLIMAGACLMGGGTAMLGQKRRTGHKKQRYTKSNHIQKS